MMNTTICKTFIFLATMLLFGACKKNDTLSTKELYVYAAPGTQAYDVIKGEIVLIRSNIISQAAFPVFISRAFEKEVEVTATIDSGMIKVYDSLYQPSMASPALPVGAFTLSGNGKVTIKAGETSSADSLQVTLVDSSKVKKGINYVVPVVLLMANNDVPVSERRRVMYMLVEINSIVKGITSLDNKNSVSVVLKNINGVNTGPDMIYLKGVLNKIAGIETTVEIKENGSAIDAFNQENGTSFIAFPAGSYQITKSTAAIARDQTESGDSLTIKIIDKSAFQQDKDYLLPVEVVEDNSPRSPLVDENKKIVYIALRVVYSNIDPSNSGLNGTAMDRKNWAVKASSQLSSNYAPSKAIDGSKSTAWVASTPPEWFQVDIKSARVVKGFRIASFNLSGIYYGDIREMEVFSSSDGTTWKSEGIYTGEPQIDKIVKFISPVNAQYFKFNITNSTLNYAAIAEINAYE